MVLFDGIIFLILIKKRHNFEYTKIASQLLFKNEIKTLIRIFFFIFVSNFLEERFD